MSTYVQRIDWSSRSKRQREQHLTINFNKELKSIIYCEIHNYEHHKMHKLLHYMHDETGNTILRKNKNLLHITESFSKKILVHSRTNNLEKVIAVTGTWSHFCRLLGVNWKRSMSLIIQLDNYLPGYAFFTCASIWTTSSRSDKCR